jgi:hypothetical protein
MGSVHERRIFLEKMYKRLRKPRQKIQSLRLETERGIISNGVNRNEDITVERLQKCFGSIS